MIKIDEKQEIKAFFSYSHADGEVDPEMILSFTNDLQKRVDARLTNASFEIWIDRERLKVGYNWNERILDAIKGSHILIVFLSPKWMGSEYCRKEYLEFMKVEAGFDIGEYVAPILIRSLTSQTKHFGEDQRNVYASLSDRQYTKALAREYITLSAAEKIAILENLADDIEGMIDRHRAIANGGGLPQRVSPKTVRRSVEFDSKAHNFEEVDVLRNAEIEIAPPDGQNIRSVYAHVGFTPRMYVQTSNMRIEFGVRRAMLSIETESGRIDRVDQWDGTLPEANAYYVRSRDNLDAITLCINPSPGSHTLEELPLPPSPGENRFAIVAAASSDIDAAHVRARLSIALSPEGLHIFGEPQSKPSVTALKKVSAIASIAVEKELTSDMKKIEHNIPVKERKG